MIGSQAQSESSTHSTLLCGIREIQRKKKTKKRLNKIKCKPEHNIFHFSISPLNFPHLFEQQLKDEFFISKKKKKRSKNIDKSFMTFKI